MLMWAGFHFVTFVGKWNSNQTMVTAPVPVYYQWHLADFAHGSGHLQDLVGQVVHLPDGGHGRVGQEGAGDVCDLVLNGATEYVADPEKKLNNYFWVKE